MLQTGSLSDAVTWDQYAAVLNQLEVDFIAYLSIHYSIQFLFNNSTEHCLKYY